MTHRLKARKGFMLGAGATVAATALLLAGCSTSAAPAASSSGSSSSNLTVAMVTPESTGEFYGAMYCGAKKASAEQGVTLNIQGTPLTTVDAETQVLQSVLATNPDGLLLTVWDNNAFNSMLTPYTDAGHPLVMPDSFLSNDKYIQSIRTDSYQSSYDAAVQALKDFKVTSGKVLILTDAPGNAIQSARAQGFSDAIAKTSPLTTLQFQYVGGDSAKASQATSSAIAANPDLSLVFSTNIGAGTGAANGIKTSGNTNIVHIGYDTSSAQVQQLRSGEYQALVAQSPFQMGYDSMTLISKILKGTTTAASITNKTQYSPWALVTAANVDTPAMAQYLYTSKC